MRIDDLTKQLGKIEARGGNDTMKIYTYKIGTMRRMLRELSRAAGVCAAVMAVALSAAAATENPATMEFTYNIDGNASRGFGFGRPDTLDICIHIDSPALEGAKVSAVRVPIPSTGGTLAEEKTAWCTPTLPTPGVNFGKEAVIVPASLENDTLSATFAEPVEIPSGGLYVGYTVTVTELVNWTQRFPVVISTGQYPGGFIMRSRERYPEWYNGESHNQVSDMRVTLQMERKANSAAFTLDQDPYGGLNGEAIVYGRLTNHGLNPISSIEYTYAYGDKKETRSFMFQKPLEGKFGKWADISLGLSADDEIGNKDIELTIIKVNGEDNLDPQNSVRGTLKTLPFIPKHRPLVEEYTGFWCGGCPVAYVLIEEGREKHGEDFNAISFHIADALQIKRVVYPNSINSHPTLYIDRGDKITGGTTPSIFNCEYIWEKERRKFSPASIDVALAWGDEEHKTLVATSTTEFAEDHQGVDYRVTYALVADDLTDPSWTQTNNYIGAPYEGKYWDIFTKATGNVKGLTYNNILASFPDCRGIEGSLPSDIKAQTPYTHSTTFNIEECEAKDGGMIYQDSGKLRVVAIVLDGATNKVFNSVSSIYSAKAETLSLDNAVTCPAEIVSTQYYDLRGVRLNNIPAADPYIRLDRLSDGTLRASKHLDRAR